MALLLNEESNTIKYLQDSLGDPEFCDVKIVATDGEVPANKTILSMSSQYFRSMFSDNNNFVEGQTGVVKMPYTKTVMEKVVFYLYSGQLKYQDLALGCLLDLMDLLNLTNLHDEFVAVERSTMIKIKRSDFSLSDCLKSLDHCSRLGLETVGEALLTHLGGNFRHFSQDQAVGTLSGDMIARLLYEKMEVESQTIVRFRTLITWLSFNLEAIMKEELLELFDFDHFTVEELATDVRRSGLYDKDRIIERMEQLHRETRTEMEAKEKMYREDIGIIKDSSNFNPAIPVNIWTQFVPRSIQDKY